MCTQLPQLRNSLQLQPTPLIYHTTTRLYNNPRYIDLSKRQSSRNSRFKVTNKNKNSENISVNDDITTLTMDDNSAESDVIIPTTNSCNNDTRDRMIKYVTEVKFVKDRYITPATVDFSSRL